MKEILREKASILMKVSNSTLILRLQCCFDRVYRKKFVLHGGIK